jgi:hypothetical protein
MASSITNHPPCQLRTPFRQVVQPQPTRPPTRNWANIPSSSQPPDITLRPPYQDNFETHFEQLEIAQNQQHNMLVQISETLTAMVQGAPQPAPIPRAPIPLPPRNLQGPNPQDVQQMLEEVFPPYPPSEPSNPSDDDNGNGGGPNPPRRNNRPRRPARQGKDILSSEPFVFDGSTHKVKEFIRLMDNHFRLAFNHFTTEEVKVIYALQRIQGGTAGLWAEQVNDAFNKAQSGEVYDQLMYFPNWNMLKAGIKEQFGDKYEIETACEKIRHAQ